MDKPEHDAMNDPHTMAHQLRAACPMGHSEKYGGHSRLPFQARFSPDSAEAMRRYIRNIVTGLINNFIERGSEFLGQNLKSGDVVLVHWMAANRDQEVLRRLPDYEVVPAEVVRYPGLNRGMSGLGARFTPGSQEGAEQ